MNGPCAKTTVRCTVRTPDGWKVSGTNECRNPQPVCPRRPGEGYEKCKSICDQVGHAEEVALLNAQDAGVNLSGATAEVVGHTYFCMNCQHALFKAGVRWLSVRQKT